ncbi:MAG: 50S ribosomal protein L24 [Candidatus Omnitrophica bacterium]|nr:50S ribosomal protein L24 [Candidatus Omnitrophota bacterium]MBU1134578.1 50S ribosomal protein L24 [Candidatus Omnitrophota bacterium]MBU1811236.1 50S ribosomal protein L24 [Candidatus Omnitrophota bacterium]
MKKLKIQNTKVLKIKKGDKVEVIAGKDKGKAGKVLKVIFQTSRAIVEGTNLVKKHLRRRSENEPGGIKEIPSSLHISNLALFCSSCGRGVRVAVKAEGKNKIKICKRCQQPI